MNIPLAAAIVLLPVSALAATVREARVTVAFSTGGCAVTAHYVVDMSPPGILHHTLLVDNAAPAPALSIVGAIGGRPEVVGRTVRVPISLTGSGRNEYGVRYAVRAGAGGDTCPLLVPSAATDGLGRIITIAVAAPPGETRLPGDFPAFQWSGNHGRIALGHLPSFVRVPHAPAGAALSWRQRVDPRRVVDVAALVTLACASLVWAALRRARA